jgi:ferredoxin-type protein NapH
MNDHPPLSPMARLWSWRYIVLRRLTQFFTLLLFFGSAHWGWSLNSEGSRAIPLLAGNLSGSEFMGIIPMADPFAALQIFLAGHLLQTEVIIGALVVLGFYALIGGRMFCAWACPINPVTDLAGWLRVRLDIRPTFLLSRNTRYFVLALTLILSVLTGLAAFEWVSPVGMMHREILFGLGFGGTVILAIFFFDLFILKHGWCGHLCPLGAFWSLVGKVNPTLKVRFDKTTCTHCGECAKVCPEPQVLNLKLLEARGLVFSGECSNCGRCTPVCPEGSLVFDFKPLIQKHNALAQGSVSKVEP